MSTDALATRILGAVTGDSAALRSLAGAIAQGDSAAIRAVLSALGVQLSEDEADDVLQVVSGSGRVFVCA